MERAPAFRGLAAEPVARELARALRAAERSAADGAAVLIKSEPRAYDP